MCDRRRVDRKSGAKMIETTKNSMAEDLIALQAKVPAIAPNAENPHYHSEFADLLAITKAIRSLLTEHNFAWLTFPSTLEGQPSLKYRLLHGSGESLDGEMLLMTASDPQKQGSAITYARRYALSAVLNIVTDKDDDAEGAIGNGNNSTNPPQHNAQRPAQAGKKAAPSKEKLDRGCPDCGVGDLELVTWPDSGAQYIGCSNFKECKHREPAPEKSESVPQPAQSLEDSLKAPQGNLASEIAELRTALRGIAQPIANAILGKHGYRGKNAAELTAWLATHAEAIEPIAIDIANKKAELAA